uniref:Uncharacterized protein n=1 Tax=Leptobrachium leishanense TaxID=445787 RepID=A0A8C5QLK6_9ANUR
MIQTIGLSVGAAVAYIIIVLGLMFYWGALLQNGQNTAEIHEDVPLMTLGNKRLSSGDKLTFPRANLHPITTLGTA